MWGTNKSGNFTKPTPAEQAEIDRLLAIAEEEAKRVKKVVKTTT